MLGLSWLFTKVQPELASKVDINQELEQFYTQLYGFEPDTVKDKVVPLLYGDVP